MTQLWLQNFPSDVWSTWILASHDSKRVATKLADPNLIDGFFILLLLLPGTPILYYGDEIGLYFSFLSSSFNIYLRSHFSLLLR